MATARNALGETDVEFLEVAAAGGAAASGISWGAIFGGAAAAVATTMILVELGAGLGLTSVSAWPDIGASAASLGIAGGLWLIFTQWIASCVGGYLAGRLRTKWTGLHTDEVFFRDTAHGFLAWAAATVAAGIVVAVAAAATLGAGAVVGGGAAQGAVQSAARPGVGPQASVAGGYELDVLLRPMAGTPPASAIGAAQGNVTEGGVSPRGEIGRLLDRGLRNGELSADDRAYLGQIVAARTGLSQDEALKRVDNAMARMRDADIRVREAADEARKATAAGAILTALAMVVGAFIASVSGALGGRLRDQY